MKTNSDFSKSKKQVIFIVDDQPLFANILKEELQNNSNTIYTFSSGEECLANMQKNPTVVILDYELDDGSKMKMNGIEVLKKIKSVNPQIEVLMLSGHEDVNVATNSIKSGAYDYVVKNESAFVNTKNKMVNMFRKIDLIYEIKEVKNLKYQIAAIVFFAVILFTVTRQYTEF